MVYANRHHISLVVTTGLPGIQSRGVILLCTSTTVSKKLSQVAANCPGEQLIGS